MYYLPSYCLVLLFIFSIFHHLSSASSKKEVGWCEALFKCGNITAGFPFSGGNRPQFCGHPSLELHCFKDKASISISDHLYDVLHIDQISKTLRLERAELRGSFCNATFSAATLPPQVFELSPSYKSLNVFYLCDAKLPHRSSYTCPNRGLVSVSENLDYHDSCDDSFTINVPKSFYPEEKELNMARLENVLREGFEVKVKIDEKACQECLSSHGICSFENTTTKNASSSRCSTLDPPNAEADELHKRCSGTFSCGDRQLFYPFWNSSREHCGHPDFKVECNTSSPEVSISSVNYRILEANYDSRTIRLARADYIDNLCPQNPLDAPFDEDVLPFAANTELLTIYNDCIRDLSQFVSTYVGDLTCEDDGDDKSYYVTRNISSFLLDGIRGPLLDFRRFCSNVTIPASGPALNTLRNDRTQDNLKKALEQGFQLGINQECHRCIESRGACGFNQSSIGFVCYCGDGTQNRTCGSKKKSLSNGKMSAIGVASVSLVAILIAGGLFCFISQRRKTSDDPRRQKLKALIPLKHYSYAQVKRITKSFAEVVGKGGFGTVYRGTLCDGRSVAVKILKESKDNGEDFINEVASMSKTSHVNIVDLLGFCSEGSKRAILYEFLENGSLDRFISRKSSMDMDWMTLYNIALGVARGLEYLHHGCKARIVHFDIKPHNILLDDNFCPKVSDFGLAKLCKKKENILSLLDARGTIGYIAPEVFSRMYGTVSHKSDVYSYGMLVLEMIGARNKERTVQNSASNTSSMYFPEWIYKDLEKAENGRLNGNAIISEEEEIAKKMTLVGLWCIQCSPSDRPSMDRVVEMMEGNSDALEVPPRPVLQMPPPPLHDSSTLSEDISLYTEVCSMNIA